MMHLRPGPTLARPGLDVGFVALDAGTAFPEHKHLGEESVLVISGEMVDLTSQDRYGPGSLVRMAKGTVHAVAAGPHETLVYLVVVGGVEIPGVEIEEPSEDALW
jgi:quercetin dioxygenase-like cupin family protein